MMRLAWTAREFAGDGRWRQLDKSMRFLVRASTGAIKAGA